MDDEPDGLPGRPTAGVTGGPGRRMAVDRRTGRTGRTPQPAPGRRTAREAWHRAARGWVWAFRGAEPCGQRGTVLFVAVFGIEMYIAIQNTATNGPIAPR
jgi:hypothetical protein